MHSSFPFYSFLSPMPIHHHLPCRHTHPTSPLPFPSLSYHSPCPTIPFLPAASSPPPPPRTPCTVPPHPFVVVQLSSPPTTTAKRPRVPIHPILASQIKADILRLQDQIIRSSAAQHSATSPAQLGSPNNTEQSPPGWAQSHVNEPPPPVPLHRALPVPRSPCYGLPYAMLIEPDRKSVV